MTSEGKRKADDREAISNIGNEIPYAGMRLEIMDNENLWSSGYLVKVDEEKGSSGRDRKTVVTVASDGWGRQWDERLEWPHKRFAHLYTYTKKVKCFVDILRPPKNKPPKKVRDALPVNAYKGYSSLWPCTVQFRMPHPGALEEGEDGLMEEEKLFIQPYALHLLPEPIRDSMVSDGGTWYHHSRLRLWKDNLSLLGVLLPNVKEAYNIAKNDTSVKGYLVPKALTPGTTLLNDTFRIYDLKGADFRDGVLVPSNASLPPGKRSKKEINPPSVVQVGPMEETDTKEEDEGKRPPRYHGPPSEPPPIALDGSIYPKQGVQKCKTSSKWISSVSQSCGELFVGTFPTQTQALQASRAAMQVSDEVERDVEKARRIDLKGITIDHVIAAFETQYIPSEHSFSLHRWTLEKANHDQYLRDLKRYEELQKAKETEGDKTTEHHGAMQTTAASTSTDTLKSAPKQRKKRKQATPMRLVS
uniref:Uncharacterized protein n=1 Tax=Grammatophora oceanica TaxID=210454 RepID=A0A7S1YIX4_9STRA